MMNERIAFEQLLDLADDGERARYLEQIGREDAELRDRLASLLRSHTEASSFLQDNLVTKMDTIAQPDRVESGVQIDRYKIREKLGEGGFGTVYVAEQFEPVRRKVALKIIKPGMDSQQVIARFEAERQSLALMNHPNIATVLDGGKTTSGHPYFVMELVSGIPITRFCEENRLNLPQRLQLFIDLCRAVQHAHQKGIIHRDLKPSNVLVTMHDDKPVVKVIDFGVAKALDNDDLAEATIYTAYGQMLGTPIYMSPEQTQLSGLDIDTRSDVYSLGVLLYELLTGTTPIVRERLRKKGLEAIRRIIREEEPVRPSLLLINAFNAKQRSTVLDARNLEGGRLSQSYRGELDWIAMKALEKDRNRRYESASALAADAERYLKNEPVLARPPSTWYRFQKFAQRRKPALLAGGFAALVFLVAAGSVGWIAKDRMTHRARLVAQTEQLFGETERLMFEQRWDEARRTLERVETLIDTQTTHPKFAQQVERLIEDLDFVGQLDNARLQHNVWLDNGFDYTASDAASDRAYVKAFKGSEFDIGHQRPVEVAEKLKARRLILPRVIAALDHWAWVKLRGDESSKEAARHFVAVSQQLDRDTFRKQIRESLVEQDAPRLGRIVDAMEAGDCFNNQPLQSIQLLAIALEHVNRLDQSIQTLRQGQRCYPSDFYLNFRLAKLIRQKDQDDPDVVRYYSAGLASSPENIVAINNLGVALRDQGRCEEAVALLRKAIRIDPSFAPSHSNLGEALKAGGKFEEAITAYRKAIELDPTSAGHVNLGMLLMHSLGREREAIAAFRRGAEAKADFLWAIHDQLAQALLKPEDNSLRDVDQALVYSREAVRLNPKGSVVYVTLGDVLEAAGHHDQEIIDTYRSGLEHSAGFLHHLLARKLLQPNDPSVRDVHEAIVLAREAIRLKPEISVGYETLGKALDVAGVNEQEVVQAYRAGLEKSKGFKGILHDQLARKLTNCKDLSLRNPAQAIVHARQAIRVAPGTDGEAHATASLGMAYYRTGRWTESVDALETAQERKAGHLQALAQFYLAMAYWQSGEEAKGRTSFDRAVEMLEEAGNQDPAVLRLRDEAAKLLGVQDVPEGEPTSPDAGERDTDDPGSA